MEHQTPIDWSPLIHTIRQQERFVLTSHVRPDADAIGSEIGMAGLLKSLGKQVRIVNASRTPPRLACLDAQNEVLTLGEHVPSTTLSDAQVMVILDTSSWQQLGAMAEVVRQSAAVKVVIDHHLSTDDLGADMYKDTSAAATGQLVCELGEALGVRMTAEIGQPLFAAVATDTGWFRFSSVSGHTYRIAAALVDSGVQPDKLYRVLYEQDTLARLKLMGIALERLKLVDHGRIAYSEIYREDFNRTGAIPPDTEDLVNLALAMAGVEVGLIFIEQLQGGVKVSFRSRNGVDCRLWAEKLGGGGHRQAAGAILADPIAEVISKVLEALPNTP